MKKLYYRTFQAVFKLAANFMNWREPEIISGDGSIKQLPKILAAKDLKNIMIVTDKTISGLGLMDEFLAELKKERIDYTVYDKTVPNPTIHNIEEALSQYKTNGCRALVGFGGGSSIDCAKGIAARLANPKKSVEKMKGLLKVGRRKTPLIAIPTTSGTGSEATVATVITDSDKHHKYAVNDLHLIPDIAVLDPLLTVKLPKNITAATGMDALCHAVEAFIGRSNTKKTRRLSIEAVKLIFENMYKCYENGGDVEARSKMQIASYKAGAAFTRAYVGNVHAVAHTLGGMYSTPHGLANAVILPYVLEFYGKAVYKPLARLSDAAGLSGSLLSNEEKALNFIVKIKELNKKMNIPDKISELKRKDIPMLAGFALKEANPVYPVPVIFAHRDFEQIYEKIISEAK